MESGNDQSQVIRFRLSWLCPLYEEFAGLKLHMCASLKVGLDRFYIGIANVVVC